MTPAEEILTQIYFLQRPDVTWVRGIPFESNTGCAMLRLVNNEPYILSCRAKAYIYPILEDDYDWKCGIGTWNDFYKGLSQEDVILVLKKAYELALENEGHVSS